MRNEFLNSMQCVLQEEVPDYQEILGDWSTREYHTAFMPAITWYSGTANLFDQKAGAEGRDLIWIIPVGQAHFYWFSTLKREIEDFYEKDEIEEYDQVVFPGIEAEEFQECILLHSDDLQNDPEHTILGANVILVRLSLSSGRDTLLFLLLTHQDQCWTNVIERHEIPLTWLVDSGRGTDDYYARVNLYQLMKNTTHRDVLPGLYFKGLYNKGEIPEGFQFLYAMLSEPDAKGYDKWQTFSGVYDTGWKR